LATPTMQQATGITGNSLIKPTQYIKDSASDIRYHEGMGKVLK